ncbi:MAG: hypothetical protein QOF51_1754 [Chloroflexota bacterium]|jgi:hypothetical protein|nr:hypothetical protein [Chloroflexota bacterium]
MVRIANSRPDSLVETVYHFFVGDEPGIARFIQIQHLANRGDLPGPLFDIAGDCLGDHPGARTVERFSELVDPCQEFLFEPH